MPAHPPASVLRDVAVAPMRIAQDVLAFLESERIPPTPQVYRLFFEYATQGPGPHSVVVRALRDGEGSGRPLAERLADGLATEAGVDAWFEATAALAGQMAALDGRVEETANRSRLYSSALDEASREFAEAGAGRAALAGVLRSLLVRHLALVEANGALRADLERAQQEITSTRAELSQTARESMRDPVTGLINRRGAENELDEMIASGAPFSLLLIDIDHFKPLNDTYGHQAGDRVLHEVGRAVLAAVRAGESVFRFGGDEFGAIVNTTDGEDLGAAAERLRRAVAEIDLVHCVGSGIVGNLTISLGVARCLGLDSTSALFERADRALFEAKRAGRNRWILAEP